MGILERPNGRADAPAHCAHAPPTNTKCDCVRWCIYVKFKFNMNRTHMARNVLPNAYACRSGNAV